MQERLYEAKQKRIEKSQAGRASREPGWGAGTHLQGGAGALWGEAEARDRRIQCPQCRGKLAGAAMPRAASRKCEVASCDACKSCARADCRETTFRAMLGSTEAPCHDPGRFGTPRHMCRTVVESVLRVFNI